MGFVRYIKAFRSLVYPDVCVCCGQLLVEGENACCLKCYYGLGQTDFHLEHDNPTARRFLGRVNISAATSRFYYTKLSLVQKAIFALKYHGNREIGLVLGRDLGQTIKISEYFSGIDIIIPIPLHPAKHRKRGYNQSEIISNGVNEILNCTVRKDIIIRNSNTKSQTKLKHVFSRWSNVGDSFTVINSEDLVNKHVLVIDDVITTGATIENCIKMIENIEGIKISVASLAIATK